MLQFQKFPIAGKGRVEGHGYRKFRVQHLLSLRDGHLSRLYGFEEFRVFFPDCHGVPSILGVCAEQT